jgi:predicted PurR-regulated permease PerM
MIIATLQWVIISLLLIVLIHYLYSFFIDTLTVPKVRDLIEKPTQRYNQIVKSTADISSINQSQSIQSQPQIQSQIQPQESNKMESELRSFLDELKKQPTSTPHQVGKESAATNTLGFSILK